MVEETRKPKIVLVYGVHLNEKAATEYLAKALKPLLEQRGFDIEIVEYPEKLTIQRLLEPLSQRISIENREQTIENTLYKFWQDWMDKILKRTDYIIDLHTTSTAYYSLNNVIRPVKFWSTRSTDGIFTDTRKPLDLISNKDFENLFILESPTISKPSSKFKTTEEHTPYLKERYFDYEVDLSATKNSGYLSPKIIFKFAHFINTTIRTRLGQYHAPRRPEFRPKADRKTAIRIEKERRKKIALKKRLLEYLRRRIPIRFRPR